MAETTIKARNSKLGSYAAEKELGVEVRTFDLIPANLKEYLISQISQLRPVVLGSEKVDHAIIVVGVDDDNVYINDPSGAFFKGDFRGTGDLIHVGLTWSEFESKIFGWIPVFDLIYPNYS